MEVRADRVGPEPLGQRLRGGRPREAAAAVADVEPDAAARAAACASGRTRPSSPRMPGPDAVKAWVTMSPGRSRREGGPDVGALGDVGHQRHAGQLGRLEGGVQRRGHVVAAGPAPEPDLDPDHDVPCSRDDRGRLARAGVPNVLELADDRRDQAGRRHVDERQHADRRGLDGVPAERPEVGEAGGPGVDGGGHPAAQVGDGVQAVRAAVVPVAVQVDQAGHDEQARDVDAAVIGRGAPRCRRRRDRRDPSVLDDDIEGAIETGAGSITRPPWRIVRVTPHSCPVPRPPSIEPARHTGRDRTHHREAA